MKICKHLNYFINICYQNGCIILGKKRSFCYCGVHSIILGGFMKKYLITSCVYMGLGLVFGVFYREFTKFHDFVGVTTLGKLHLHALVLGMFFFLIVTLLGDRFSFKTSKLEPYFYYTYNVGMGIFLLTLLIRGILQVTGSSISSGANSAIAGIAGIGHITLAVGLVLFFVILFQKTGVFSKEKKSS